MSFYIGKQHYFFKNLVWFPILNQLFILYVYSEILHFATRNIYHVTWTGLVD